MSVPVNHKYPLFLREINKNNNDNSQTSLSGGYPVVTVKDDFNIEAKPNTFYNIKNNTDSEININFKDDYRVDGKGKHIMFTFDGWEENEFGAFFARIGGSYISDTSKEGYKYKMEIDLSVLTNGYITGALPVYFSDEVKTGNSVTCLLDGTGLGNDSIIISINNIQVLTDNVDYLVWITYSVYSDMTSPHIFIEIENDSQEYQHKYIVWGMLAIELGINTIYTNEPYTTATSFYDNGTDITSIPVITIEVKPNMFLPSSDIANEFVFNINSPANITFNQAVRWNNNIVPDFTQAGTYTISIVNGVGCYTFV